MGGARGVWQTATRKRKTLNLTPQEQEVQVPDGPPPGGYVSEWSVPVVLDIEGDDGVKLKQRLMWSLREVTHSDQTHLNWSRLEGGTI